MSFFSIRKFSAAILLLLLCCATPGVPQTGPSGHDVVEFLNQAIQWYRQIASDRPLATDSSDILYLDNLHDMSLEALGNCFAFARAVAGLHTAQGEPDTTPTASSGHADSVNAQSLKLAAAQAQTQVNQLQGQVDDLEKQVAGATPKKAQSLHAQLAETRAELELAQARSETLSGFLQFLGSTASGARAGLAGQIDELERTVPELASVAGAKKATTASATAPAAQHKEQASGIIAMIEEIFAFNAKLGAEKDAAHSTAALAATMQKLRGPLIQELRTTSQQGESLTQAPDLTDPAAVQQRTQQLAQLTQRFKLDSAAVVPLGKALVQLDSVRATLNEWQRDTNTAFRQALRRLMIRLFFLLIGIIVVLVASEVWRRATMRYVQDMRRRNQLMLLRRIVVGIAMLLIVVFMLVTEIGSIATFAGFITAGLAVALQTVILSVVAYFLLIGKWGIRVGDRISVSGVTGDVIDIGLVRMHMMEVDGKGGEEQPTGRVVVFSNAVLFQPTANFFKQIPGTNFTWHELTLTLAPETDYRRAETLLMEAVKRVFADYGEDIQRQHNYMQRTLTVPVKAPHPQSRFRFTANGLELVIRYPVPLEKVSHIDDQVTRAVVQAIREEPSLNLVKQGTPAIQPVPEPAKPA